MKKNSQNNFNPNEPKYSKIQYYFWLLSGCEINILKDCPTDYNRQAGIGFTIFMTTVLAFFSGSYAGWYFGESYVTAIIFGLLWSTLIFSIDRSMVVTLKKDPTLKEQKFWAPLISRGIMALLIAFIISIPLELLIFKDSIDIHKSEFKQNKTLNIKYGQTSIENIDEKKDISQNLDNNINELNLLLSKGEPQNDTEYNSLKNELRIAENKYNSLKNKYRLLSEQTYNALNSQDIEKYNDLLNKKRSANNSMGRFYTNNYSPKKNKLENYLQNWKSEKNRENEDLRNQKRNIDSKIIISTEKIDNAGKIIDSTISKHDNSFVFNFMVLEDLASSQKKVLKEIKINKSIKKEWVYEENPEGSTIIFLLWLIRILFFTIEILPTIAKISTPLGAYDFAIYRKEKEIEEDLERRKEDYLLHQKAIRELENSAHQEQIIEKNKIENKLHSDMLKEIASAQNDVAKKQIEDFRSKHLS